MAIGKKQNATTTTSRTSRTTSTTPAKQGKSKWVAAAPKKSR